RVALPGGGEGRADRAFGQGVTVRARDATGDKCEPLAAVFPAGVESERGEAPQVETRLVAPVVGGVLPVDAGPSLTAGCGLIDDVDGMVDGGRIGVVATAAFGAVIEGDRVCVAHESGRNIVCGGGPGIVDDQGVAAGCCSWLALAWYRVRRASGWVRW